MMLTLLITERCREHLGCWRDTKNRAITDSISGGYIPFDTRPVENCQDRATAHGYSVFAVQASKACFTAPDAESTYKKYGPATNCKDGVGGPWANDVYKIVTCGPGIVVYRLQRILF